MCDSVLTCVHTDSGSQINTLLSHIGFLVGTPVSLRLSIVVHLAVLCSTLCSQHVRHLKPDTYGPASCWSDTTLPSLEPLPMLGMFHWTRSDAFNLRLSNYLLAKLSLRTLVLFFLPCLFHLNHTMFTLKREQIMAWVSKTLWFNFPYHSLLSEVNWLNSINREACSVEQRWAGMRDGKGMREGSSWCEGVSPHNGRENLVRDYQTK